MQNPAGWALCYQYIPSFDSRRTAILPHKKGGNTNRSRYVGKCPVIPGRIKSQLLPSGQRAHPARLDECVA
jgi:hypothetical protein